MPRKPPPTPTQDLDSTRRPSNTIPIPCPPPRGPPSSTLANPRLRQTAASRGLARANATTVPELGAIDRSWGALRNDVCMPDARTVFSSSRWICSTVWHAQSL
ncbi:uncharacterized protein CC84DRAFT_1160188, partial [Paraphaeosphaeria sporulosa]